MRQFGCIEITETVALALRDAVRPFTKFEGLSTVVNVAFCEKVYKAILMMRAEDLPAVNIDLTEQEALLINQCIQLEEAGELNDLLEQTWLVIYERLNGEAYPRGKASVAHLAESETPQLRIVPGREKRERR